MSRSATALVLAALIATSAGCGDDEADRSVVRPTATGDRSHGAGVVDRDSDVGIRDSEYAPKRTAIPAGASVDWFNSGDVTHTVTWESGPGKHFDSGPIGPRESYRRTFPANGLIRYRCTIHPEMRGSVRVYR